MIQIVETKEKDFDGDDDDGGAGDGDDEESTRPHKNQWSSKEKHARSQDRVRVYMQTCVHFSRLVYHSFLL